MREDTVIESLRRFISTELLEGDESLTPSTPLLEYGVLNSMEVHRVMAFIEKTFGIKVPAEHINAESLKNIHSMARLVLRLSPR